MRQAGLRDGGPRIAVLTHRYDLHAHAVRHLLERDHGCSCHIVETDDLSGRDGLTWSTLEAVAPTVPANDGRAVDVRSLDLIWWRRADPPQPEGVTDPHQLALIANDSQATVLGLLLNEFRGIWLDHPLVIRRAENKLVQLAVAREAGFRVPETLVSQDPEQIRQFCRRLGNRAVVKAVRGAVSAPIATTMVTDEILAADASMRLCPAIYQEHIAGNRHIRAHCFGDEIHAALIEAEALDWRLNLNVAVSETRLDGELAARLRRVLALLGLRMGVFDLKLTDEGEPVWLEVNPQGQFLFIEGLGGPELRSLFADFLVREATRRLRLPTRTVGRLGART